MPSGRTTVWVGEFTPREKALEREILDLEAVVLPADWFLRSIIGAKRTELEELVSSRIVGDRDRFLKWKHSWRQSPDISGAELLGWIRCH
jgi:hypothetical protein